MTGRAGKGSHLSSGKASPPREEPTRCSPGAGLPAGCGACSERVPGDPPCPRHFQSSQDLFLLQRPPEENRRILFPASPQPVLVYLSTGSMLGLLPQRSTGREQNTPRGGAGVAPRQFPAAAGGCSPFAHGPFFPGTRGAPGITLRRSVRSELSRRGMRAGCSKHGSYSPHPRGHGDSVSQPRRWTRAAFRTPQGWGKHLGSLLPAPGARTKP